MSSSRGVRSKKTRIPSTKRDAGGVFPSEVAAEVASEGTGSPLENATVELAAPLVAGWLVYVSRDGLPFVTYEQGADQPTEARTAVDAPHDLVFGEKLRRPVLLCLEPGHPPRPVIVGFIQERFVRADSMDRVPLRSSRDQDVTLEGRTISLEAREELSLRCGAGTITIRKDGKVLVRGTEVVSSAAGRNRVKGGVVSIN
jgi:hypothetical protein